MKERKEQKKKDDRNRIQQQNGKFNSIISTCSKNINEQTLQTKGD